MSRIYTIGHSTHDPETFASLLARNGVELLADVRHHPGSRHVPWTNPGSIEAALPVPYTHIVELGGRRRPRPGSPNDFWRNAAFRGYADYMDSEGFAAGLERLLVVAEGSVAIMCAEAQWWRCHRRLIADALVARGSDVVHIDSRGGTEMHRLTDAAVVEDGRIVYPAQRDRLGP
ncbi:MAG: DUF488 domain-containing protein [Actinobacteria bacterium]|nr:DUF488 domain-containing protein [Actinomycetota bacterium]OJU80542.1 MAG: hypothetical protein BGO11_07395 [Solirubrobacterales bacterium 70-9]